MGAFRRRHAEQRDDAGTLRECVECAGDDHCECPDESGGEASAGIDSGRVQIVPNQVRILIPGADVVHASEAVNAYKVVSDGYDQAVADGASGFEGAAHGTTSGARLSGGVDSTAVGIAQMGWSAAMQAAAGQNTAAAGYTQTATDVGAHATSPGAKSNDAAPVAPGFFTLLSSWRSRGLRCCG